jgi:hypothetical protein
MPYLLAYIDPGSGSLVIQAVIAALLAVPFLLRQQIGRVVRAVRREEPETPPRGTTRDLPH